MAIEEVGDDKYQSVERDINVLRGELLMLSAMIKSTQDMELPGFDGWQPKKKTVEGSGGYTDNSSFAYVSSSADIMTFRTGIVSQAGYARFVFENPTIQVLGGTSGTPWYVQVRVESSTGPSSAVLVCTANDLQDDSTYHYKTIAEVYLESGVAVMKFDRRHDFVLRSPI